MTKEEKAFVDKKRNQYISARKAYESWRESNVFKPKEKYEDKLNSINQAKEDKIAWVKEFLSKDVKVNIVLKEEKKNFCLGRDSYLIDDLKENIKEWTENGGTGILFESAEKTLAKLKESNLIE